MWSSHFSERLEGTLKKAERKISKIMAIRMQGTTLPLHLMSEGLENREFGTCSGSHIARDRDSWVSNSGLQVPLTYMERCHMRNF